MSGQLLTFAAVLLTVCAAAWNDASAQQGQRTGPPDRQAPAASGLRSVNVGFVRHAYGTWTAKIADGSFDTATGRTIRWFPHDTDSTVVAALSSGRLDIALTGNSVAASAIARGLDLRIFYVLGTSAHSEGLVVGEKVAFKPGDAKSLQGKVIAVPFGSTPHFRLLESLKRWGTSVGSMRIVNLQTAQIAQAWQRNEIDAAVVSEPLLSLLGERGKRAPLPAASDNSGLLVFAASGEFVAEHVVFLSRFVDVIARAEQIHAMRSAPPTEDSPEVKAIALITGLHPSVVVATIGRYRPPSIEEQLTASWLGGGMEAALISRLKAAIDIWRWAGRLPGGDTDLATAIAIEPLQMALGYQR